MGDLVPYDVFKQKQLMRQGPVSFESVEGIPCPKCNEEMMIYRDDVPFVPYMCANCLATFTEDELGEFSPGVPPKASAEMGEWWSPMKINEPTGDAEFPIPESMRDKVNSMTECPFCEDQPLWPTNEGTVTCLKCGWRSDEHKFAAKMGESEQYAVNNGWQYMGITGGNHKKYEWVDSLGIKHSVILSASPSDRRYEKNMLRDINRCMSGNCLHSQLGQQRQSGDLDLNRPAFNPALVQDISHDEALELINQMGYQVIATRSLENGDMMCYDARKPGLRKLFKGPYAPKEQAMAALLSELPENRVSSYDEIDQFCDFLLEQHIAAVSDEYYDPKTKRYFAIPSNPLWRGWSEEQMTRYREMMREALDNMDMERVKMLRTLAEGVPPGYSEAKIADYFYDWQGYYPDDGSLEDGLIKPNTPAPAYINTPNKCPKCQTEVPAGHLINLDEYENQQPWKCPHCQDGGIPNQMQYDDIGPGPNKWYNQGLSHILSNSWDKAVCPHCHGEFSDLDWLSKAIINTINPQWICPGCGVGTELGGLFTQNLLFDSEDYRDDDEADKLHSIHDEYLYGKTADAFGEFGREDYVELWRGMTEKEYKKWTNGMVIHPGKYFTQAPKKFYVHKSLVKNTSPSTWRLLGEAFLTGSDIIDPAGGTQGMMGFSRTAKGYYPQICPHCGKSTPLWKWEWENGEQKCPQCGKVALESEVQYQQDLNWLDPSFDRKLEGDDPYRFGNLSPKYYWTCPNCNQTTDYRDWQMKGWHWFCPHCQEETRSDQIGFQRTFEQEEIDRRSKTAEYNGYDNWETSEVDLWAENEEFIYNTIMKYISQNGGKDTVDIAQFIKAEVEEFFPYFDQWPTLDASKENIDWIAIAQMWKSSWMEEQEYMDTPGDETIDDLFKSSGFQLICPSCGYKSENNFHSEGPVFQHWGFRWDDAEKKTHMTCPNCHKNFLLDTEGYWQHDLDVADQDNIQDYFRYTHDNKSRPFSVKDVPCRRCGYVPAEGMGWEIAKQGPTEIAICPECGAAQASKIVNPGHNFKLLGGVMDHEPSNPPCPYCSSVYTSESLLPGTQSKMWLCNNCNEYFDIDEPGDFTLPDHWGKISAARLQCPYCGYHGRGDHLEHYREWLNRDRDPFDDTKPDWVCPNCGKGIFQKDIMWQQDMDLGFESYGGIWEDNTPFSDLTPYTDQFDPQERDMAVSEPIAAPQIYNERPLPKKKKQLWYDPMSDYLPYNDYPVKPI